jgi:hypothetical protein
MAVLTIRDVSDEVKTALAREARERGQSLQSYLLSVLNRQAAFAGNQRILGEIERDLATIGGAGEDAPDASELLARARLDHADTDNDPHVRGTGGAA